MIISKTSSHFYLLARIAYNGIINQVGVNAILLNIIYLQPKIGILLMITVSKLETKTLPSYFWVHITQFSRKIKTLGIYLAAPIIGSKFIGIWVEIDLPCLLIIF